MLFRDFLIWYALKKLKFEKPIEGAVQKKKSVSTREAVDYYTKTMAIPVEFPK